MSRYGLVQHHVGGRFVAALSGERFTSVDPATGEVLAEIEHAREADVDRAVAAAKAGFAVWSRMTGAERGRILKRTADILRERNGALAEIETRDTGKPIQETIAVDILSGADCLEYFAGIAATLTGEHVDLGPAAFGYTRREPLGVVAGIGAWNYPIQIACWKSAPALACGNAMIFKPAELTPLTAPYLAEAFREAGLPDGVFNVLQGDARTGQALVAHPGIAKVSLTGEAGTGRVVMGAAAKTLKHVTLELGGKSPLIVMDDANLDAAVPAAAWGVFGNSGQACYACSRVYVQEDVYPRFVERLKDFAASMTYGAPQSPDTDLGPLISRDHRDRVAERVERERTEGGSLLLGGTFGEGGGFGYRPTIIGDCAPQSAAMREEIFGPVVCVTPFRSVDEVVVAANDTAYGLAAGLFTNDLNRAHTIAQQLRAGTVWINCYAHVDPTQPFGGYKQSGWGREFGPDALEPFLEVKSVQIALG
jgi:betaine-aldehyde dehydrogenase